MDQTWLEKVKIYAVEVILRRVTPAAAASLLSFVVAALAAHANSLEDYGVNYIADWSAAWVVTHSISGHVLLIELDTSSLKVIGAVFTGAAALAAMLFHHTAATVTGKPQSGGQRATDQVDSPPSA